jgi:hypothetical protein
MKKTFVKLLLITLILSVAGLDMSAQDNRQTNFFEKYNDSLLLVARDLVNKNDDDEAFQILNQINTGYLNF